MPRFEIRRSRGRTTLEEGEYLHSLRPRCGFLTRGVWDALAAAALLRGERDTPRKILLLGVGGGSVLHLWDHLLQRWSWEGVEFDANARRALREDFGLPATAGVLHAAEAHAFVRATRRRFDVIVDDLFDAGARPTFDQPGWLPLLAQRLRPGGVLITNLVWADERPRANRAYLAMLRARFAHLALLRHEAYENHVVAGCNQPLDVRGLHRRFCAAASLRSAWRGLSARTLRPALIKPARGML